MRSPGVEVGARFLVASPLAKSVTVTTRRGTQYHIKREEAARLRSLGKAQYLNEEHTHMVETTPAGFDTCWKITPSEGMPVWQYQP